MTAKEILDKYISFFEKRGHIRIENSSLVPLNDPTTLFTSSGMQPLVPFLLGETHPSGVRLVNAQNCFRAQDIDEIGDNRHTTFFRMLGNWSLGNYFKKEQLPWFFEFLTDELGLSADKLYVTVFAGDETIPKDIESIEIWKNLFSKKGIKAEIGERIFEYDVTKNWWSRAGTPDKMPVGEPGGPDSEVFYDFGVELQLHEKSEFKDLKCHVNCDCGRYLEIGNSVFMQYIKKENGFENLPKQNVDFGGGLERLVAATENKQDVFETSLFSPIIETIVNTTAKSYEKNSHEMRVILDHFVASMFIALNNIKPSNKEQGYILRRLIRRGLDNFYLLNGDTIVPILEKIAEQYSPTDPLLKEKFEEIKLTILEEEGAYQKALSGGKKLIEKEIAKISEEVTVGDELMGVTEISADTAFKAITSYGLGPTQLKSLGYTFDEQELSEKIKEHQDLSRKGAAQKFAGGLADHSELTIKGHTATHLMHQALRDVLGNNVHQTGSNITPERVRFDFTFDRKLTDEEIQKVKEIVLQKIKEDLPVHYEIMPIQKAKDLHAIGLFDEKYGNDVKVYFIGKYSKEFCGGPHVEHTGLIESFDILKEEGVARGVRRIYAKIS
jgi:alanyl-tRNA synthetase